MRAGCWALGAGCWVLPFSGKTVDRWLPGEVFSRFTYSARGKDFSFSFLYFSILLPPPPSPSKFQQAIPKSWCKYLKSH